MNQEKLKKEQLKAKKQILAVGMASRKEIDISEARRKARLSNLMHSGVIVRNNGMSAYINKISPGCIDCSRATALTVITTTECNRRCYFCFYPGPHKEKVKLTNIIKDIVESRNFLLSLAVTGGECLLNLDATIAILEFAKTVTGNLCQTRIYTNGDMLNRNYLKKLQAAGLDEIRISTKPGEMNFNKIALAKEYIPRVLVETPVFPDKEKEMRGVLLKLNKLKIFGVNLLEFVFCSRNAHIYRKKGYKLTTDKINDFSKDYCYDYPVYGSEASCFNLLEFAKNKKLSIGVHYCSLNNKRYGNYEQRPKRLEIHKRVKSEFIKEGKCDKKFILKHWVA